MEIFEDSNPFIYDHENDTVRYRTDFGHLNPEAIYPDASDWIDGLKIAKLTTWTPEKGPYVDAAMYDSTKVLADKIDFVCWAKIWFSSPTVWIGVYNSRPEEGSVDFSIRMRDYVPFATYPE